MKIIKNINNITINKKKISYRWAKPIGAGGDYPIQEGIIITRDITLYFN